MVNSIVPKKKRGRKKENLTEDQKRQRNFDLAEKRKKRLFETMALVTLDKLSDNFPVTYDALPVVAGITYSRTQISKLIKAGKFPSAIRLGAHRIAWSAGDIRAYLAAGANSKTFVTDGGRANG